VPCGSIGSALCTAPGWVQQQGPCPYLQQLSHPWSSINTLFAARPLNLELLHHHHHLLLLLLLLLLSVVGCCCTVLPVGCRLHRGGCV
jgi:hypothetical protein